MPTYRYTGGVPRMLFGLVHGVNAHGSKERLKHGQTVVVDPGDTVRTDEPYDHAHLEEIESEPPTPAPRRRTNKKEGVTER